MEQDPDALCGCPLVVLEDVRLDVQRHAHITVPEAFRNDMHRLPSARSSVADVCRKP
jgi:hypothetical protein